MRSQGRWPQPSGLALLKGVPALWRHHPGSAARGYFACCHEAPGDELDRTIRRSGLTRDASRSPCSASSSLTLTPSVDWKANVAISGNRLLTRLSGRGTLVGAPGPSAEDQEGRLLQVSRKDASALGGGATPQWLGRAIPRLYSRSASPDSGRSRMEAQRRNSTTERAA